MDPGETGAFLSKEGSHLGNAQGETPAGVWCFPAEGTQAFLRKPDTLSLSKPRQGGLVF